MGVRPALPKKRALVALAAGVTVSALVTGGGLAIAAIPSTATGDITSCVSSRTGAVRIIDAQAGKNCGSGERTVTWSKGFRFRGGWSSSASYAVKDLVTYGGSTYLARTSSKSAKPGASTAWVMLAAKGATGPQGPKGQDGYDGWDGATILSGAGLPASAVGYWGDYYLDTATSTLYGPKTDAGWPATGLRLKGEKGDTGSKGDPGIQGLPGVDGADGSDGWDGATILSGTSAPTGADGSLGDYYLDTTTYTFYGPKTQTGWGDTGLVLKGADGKDGADGADGKDGADGADGKDGATGPQGPQGPQGPAGAETPLLFTSSVAFDGLTAQGGPAYDSTYDPQTALPGSLPSGCWGAVVGRNTGCVNKYDSALMAGPNNVVKDLYVRAPGLDLQAGDKVTVTVIVGSSPGNMGTVGYGSYGLSCTLVKVTGAQPNCQVSTSALPFPAQSGYFLGVQLTTNSSAPLHGTAYVSFELGKA